MKDRRDALDICGHEITKYTPLQRQEDSPQCSGHCPILSPKPKPLLQLYCSARLKSTCFPAHCEHNYCHIFSFVTCFVIFGEQQKMYTKYDVYPQISYFPDEQRKQQANTNLCHMNLYILFPPSQSLWCLWCFPFLLLLHTMDRL